MEGCKQRDMDGARFRNVTVMQRRECGFVVFSGCGSIPPLLHITMCEWRILIARPDQSMNTHPPA